MFNDRRYVVNIDRFIIGRGKNTANLVIDDPNVSRQHLVIERVGNQFFLVDSGSTNGVFCNGRERCEPDDPGADAEGCIEPTRLPCPPGLSCTEAEGGGCLAACDADSRATAKAAPKVRTIARMGSHGCGDFAGFDIGRTLAALARRPVQLP